MTVPVATYRLQLRGGMDLDRAATIVPYLKRLGVSHLYLSPPFTATTGSTHGYDITDPNAIDPAIGGAAGLERLSRSLRSAGLKLVIDIVPNHMAASMENPWWRDVVEWGRQSRFAYLFDIDWSRRLTLPILGAPFAEALASGDLTLLLDRDAGCLALATSHARLPLHPPTWPLVLSRIPIANGLGEAAAAATPASAEALHESARRLAGEAKGLDDALRRLSGDHALLAAIHEAQPWELTSWREANRTLSYRRFFEVTGLVGVRVEDDAAFEATHALILDLVRSGKVDGLRVDHVDGLADPAGYLAKLRQAAGDDVYIIVEKILGEDERLPSDWPVAGTTGYEFVDALADCLAEPNGLAQLGRAYEAMTGAQELAAARRSAKTQVITVNFAGELNRLLDRLQLLAEGSGRENLRRALVALIVSFDVYRTYSGPEGAAPTDRAALARARQQVLMAEPDLATEALDFICGVISGGGPVSSDAHLARRLFQQLCGAAMAKGVEDTLFYRDHRAMALNEVGCDPGRVPSLAAFHRKMRERTVSSRHSLSATATHDTKRGEDARARLLALTEDPRRWARAVSHWCRSRSRRVRRLKGGPAPEPETEWMLYQGLAGAWPDGLAPDDGAGVGALRDRYLAFVEKALREAKLRTSWTEIDAAYEAAVADYARELFEDRGFLEDFLAVLEPYRLAGRYNSLTQTLLKLTAPGVPDIYQGTEGADYSVVDPDNRRPVDFDALAGLLEVPGASLASRKIAMVSRLLDLRRGRLPLFRDGGYQPLEVTGPRARHLVAFARLHGADAVLVVAPRLVVGLLRDGGIDPAIWHGTQIVVPEQVAHRRWRDVFTGSEVGPAGTIDAAQLFGDEPCCVLAAEPVEG